jgi:hypothetical protein
LRQKTMFIHCDCSIKQVNGLLPIAEDGMLFAWGCNKLGQLGIAPLPGNNQYEKVPEEILTFRGLGPREICANNEYSAVITGKVRLSSAVTEICNLMDGFEMFSDSLFGSTANYAQAQSLVQSQPEYAAQRNTTVTEVDMDSFEYIRDVQLAQHELKPSEANTANQYSHVNGASDDTLWNSTSVAHIKSRASAIDIDTSALRGTVAPISVVHVAETAESSQLLMATQAKAIETFAPSDARPEQPLEVPFATKTRASAESVQDDSADQNSTPSTKIFTDSSQPASQATVASQPMVARTVPDDLPPPPPGYADDDGSLPDRGIRPFPPDLDLGVVDEREVRKREEDLLRLALEKPVDCPEMQPGQKPTEYCHKQLYPAENKTHVAHPSLATQLQVLDAFRKATGTHTNPSTTLKHIPHDFYNRLRNESQHFEPGTSPASQLTEVARMRNEINRNYANMNKWGEFKIPESKIPKYAKKIPTGSHSTNTTTNADDNNTRGPEFNAKHRTTVSVDTKSDGVALVPALHHHRDSKILVKEGRPAANKMEFDLYEQRRTLQTPVYGINMPRLFLRNNRTSPLGEKSEWDYKAEQLDQEFLQQPHESDDEDMEAEGLQEEQEEESDSSLPLAQGLGLEI